MLPTFVIGLREGLEAALIVGIVAAFLGQQRRRDALRMVWWGTGAAVVICFAVGVALELVSANLPQRGQERLETVVGAFAVVMVSYMLIWTKRHARHLRGDLETAAASALVSGSARALVTMAFLAVLREGFETVVFLLAAFRASGDQTSSGIGAGLGIVVAVGLGYGIYRGGVRINLARFFAVTGLVLVLVAAGLVVTAVHTANEGGWINFGQQQLLDLSWLVRPGTVVSSLVTGVLGIQPYPVRVEVAAWALYLVPMLALLSWPRRRPPRGRPADQSRGAGRKATSRRGVAAATVGVALVASACASSSSGKVSTAQPASAREVDVNIVLTSSGCAPSPTKITAGHVNFAVSNKNAGAVSEAELRSANLSHILGEQENLTPGLSGGFSLTLQPGKYVINCPGAHQQHWPLTVTGKATGPAWTSNPQLTKAVASYSTYIDANAAALVNHTQLFCQAISAGNLHKAELLYSPARIYYERIEPVAEIWGNLDTEIDGRLGNPVTDPAQFMGFHKIEQLLWSDDTLVGAAGSCSGLVTHEKQLQKLVATAQYSPLEMAAGATDLINEAATSKISGEEERYSNVDLPTLAANVDGAMEVVSLLKPYLSAHDPTLVALVDQRDQGVDKALAPDRANPGYLDTGYVEYSTVLDAGRKNLSGAINALAEALSGISSQVG